MEENIHKKLGVEDKLYLIGEIEHARRHALKSAAVAEEKEDKIFYYVKANQALELRRKHQEKLGPIKITDWCLTKVATEIKQLNQETFDGDMELFEETQKFADGLASHALETDLSGCQSCESDANA